MGHWPVRPLGRASGTWMVRIVAAGQAAAQRAEPQALMTLWSSAPLMAILRGFAFSATGISNRNTPPW